MSDIKRGKKVYQKEREQFDTEVGHGGSQFLAHMLEMSLRGGSTNCKAYDE